MPWVSLGYSKEEINAAGNALRDAPGGLDAHTLEVLSNWRASHAWPMWVTQLTLRKKASAVDPANIPAQRIKRLSSIQSKLRRMREQSLTLWKMQDIAGCRVIARDCSAVDQIRL